MWQENESKAANRVLETCHEKVKDLCGVSGNNCLDVWCLFLCCAVLRLQVHALTARRLSGFVMYH